MKKRGEDDEKFATVADIEQFLSEQAKFRKNTVSGKFEVLMTDCGEEYAELTDRYVNTLWSRMNKAGMLARIADIRSVLDSGCLLGTVLLTLLPVWLPAYM